MYISYNIRKLNQKIRLDSQISRDIVITPKKELTKFSHYARECRTDHVRRLHDAIYTIYSYNCKYNNFIGY